MMGVDYELFWTLNPKTLSPFVKAFELSQKNEDCKAWQYGLYVRMAISSCISKEEYPKQPLMTKGKVKEKVMSAEEIKNKMFAKMKSINATLGKE